MRESLYLPVETGAVLLDQRLDDGSIPPQRSRSLCSRDQEKEKVGAISGGDSCDLVHEGVQGV